MTVDSSATIGRLDLSAAVSSSLSRKFMLADQFSDAVETRVCKASKCAAVRGSAVARPIDEHCAPDDQFSRNKSPVAAVLAIVAAVTHDEETVFRHLHRFPGNAK